MFVQQRMTPTTADPAQQKMMMFMPLVFMSMFVWAPSGLVLYWTVEQPLGDRPADAHEPADRRRRCGRSRGRQAERRLKSAGGGTDGAGDKGAEVMDLHGRVHEFMQKALGAMGVPLDDRDRRRRPTACGSSCRGEDGEVLLRRKGGGARRAAADRQHRVPPRARTTIAHSSSTAWTTARRRMPS